MKCPECIKEGKKSIVTEGARSAYLVHHPIMYDEDGHLMDTFSGNNGTVSYSCSNGHQWTEKY